jgi:IMP cyclohydrolase
MSHPATERFNESLTEARTEKALQGYQDAKLAKQVVLGFDYCTDDLNTPEGREKVGLAIEDADRDLEAARLNALIHLIA